MQLNGFKYCKGLYSSIWLIDETLTSTTTLVQSGTGSNGNEGIVHILQYSQISWSDGLASYPEHSLGVYYPSAEMQSAYYTVPANWASKLFVLYWLIDII